MQHDPDRQCCAIMSGCLKRIFIHKSKQIVFPFAVHVSIQVDWHKYTKEKYSTKRHFQKICLEWGTLPNGKKFILDIHGNSRD